MARNSTAHITKMDFLAAFQKAYSKAITPDTIRGSFRGAGLIPLNPEAVISRLGVRLCTPTPPPDPGLPQPQTPRNVRDMQSQSTLIRERIARHQGSSPTAILGMLDQLERGIEGMVHHAVLIQDQFSTFQKATVAATSRKTRKRRYIQKEGALTIEEGTRLAGQQADGGNGVELGEAGPSRAKGAEAPQRRCSRCGEAGHNSRTCQEDCEVSAILDQQSAVD